MASCCIGIFAAAENAAAGSDVAAAAPAAAEM
jgi:hypothetical protein